jgi:prophage DNA circulation protein
MYRFEAIEAAPIVKRSLIVLLQAAPTRGREGADLRTAVGDTIAHAERLIYLDEIADALDECFMLAEQTGATFEAINQVRLATLEAAPLTVGATMVKNSIIHFCLITQANILAVTQFVSKGDVDKIKGIMNESFAQMEEVAADEMAQMVYQGLVKLHAAVTFYLVETARPLPRLVTYRFAAQLSSLGVAYKLYDDAGRCDELRVENKIVHPAFMTITGRALSA